MDSSSDEHSSISSPPLPCSSSTAASVLAFNVELLPVCGPSHRPGRPSALAQSLCRRLHAVLTSSALPSAGAMPAVRILESGAADAADANPACCPPLQWRICVDVYVLEDAGGLFDACLLSAVAALRHLRLPVLCLAESALASAASAASAVSGEQVGLQQQAPTTLSLPCVHPTAEARALPVCVDRLPAALSFGVLDGELLADPTHHENELLAAALHVVVARDGHLLLTLQPGGEAIAPAQLATAIKQARVHSAHLLSLVDGALEGEE
jgi:exosome complex component RRP43